MTNRNLSYEEQERDIFGFPVFGKKKKKQPAGEDAEIIEEDEEEERDPYGFNMF